MKKKKTANINTDVVPRTGGMTSQSKGLHVAVKTMSSVVALKAVVYTGNGYLNCPLMAAWVVRRLPEAPSGRLETAGKDISPQSVTKGFQKCFVSNNPNRTPS